jgi:hypothetical protein
MRDRRDGPVPLADVLDEVFDGIAKRVAAAGPGLSGAASERCPRCAARRVMLGDVFDTMLDRLVEPVVVQLDMEPVIVQLDAEDRAMSDEPRAVVREVDGRLVLDDPVAAAVACAVAKHNCGATYAANAERASHFRRRAAELGRTPAEVVVVVLAVDDDDRPKPDDAGFSGRLADPTPFAVPDEMEKLRKQLAPIPKTYEGDKVVLPPKTAPSDSYKGPTLRQLCDGSPDVADATVMAAHAMICAEVGRQPALVLSRLGPSRREEHEVEDLPLGRTLYTDVHAPVVGASGRPSSPLSDDDLFWGPAQ